MAALLLCCACGRTTQMDLAEDVAGEADAGGDLGTGVGTGQGPFTIPRAGISVAPTGGGGSRDAASFHLRVTVGPPMPVGRLRSRSYTLLLGPQGLQP